MIRILIFLTTLTASSVADVKSTTGQVKFDIQMDSQAEMTLNGTGLGIGISPSANLHVNGNAIVSNQLIVGGMTGSSNLNVSGTLGYGFQVISSNTILGESSTILADSSSDNILITLPYAGNVNGRQYQIKKISDINTVWIAGGGNLIDDTSTVELPSNSLASVQLISNGVQWYKISQKDLSVTVASANLVGWWKMDEVSGNNCVDTSGQNYDGIMTNMDSSDIGVTGKFNQALYFDDNNNFVDINHSAGLNPTEFSISLWFEWDNLGTNDTDFLFSKFMTNYELHTGGSSGIDGLRFIPAGHTASTLDAISVIHAGWNHIVAIYSTSNSTAQIYLDGVMVAEKTGIVGTDDLSIDSSNISIGRRLNGTFYFGGKIDDVRLYNKTLSPAEVQAIFQNGQ